MKIIAVRGITGSGKTTTIEYIIKELCERGYQVASLKEIHFEKFTIDQEGTNTHRHKVAGSQLVIARGYYETDIMFQEKLPMKKILSFYEDKYDYLILEGVSDLKVPTILTAHQVSELEERWDDFVFAVSGRISEYREDYKGIPAINALTHIKKLVDLIEKKAYDRLPDFPAKCCQACGCSCEELGRAIVKGEAKRKDCILTRSEVVLKIDGKEMEMVPFVQKMLRNAVMGVVGELDGYQKYHQVEVMLHE